MSVELEEVLADGPVVFLGSKIQWSRIFWVKMATTHAQMCLTMRRRPRVRGKRARKIKGFRQRQWERRKTSKKKTPHQRSNNLTASREKIPSLYGEPFWQSHPPTNSPTYTILLLGLSVNQAGLEQSFSDLKIKKNTPPKPSAAAKAWETYPNGVSQLLAVPRYADLLEDDMDGDKVGLPNPKPGSGLLVKSRAAWQKEMAKWVQEEQACSDDSDDDDLGKCNLQAPALEVVLSCCLGDRRKPASMSWQGELTDVKRTRRRRGWWNCWSGRRKGFPTQGSGDDFGG